MEQNKIKYHELMKLMRKHFNRKLCMAPDRWKTNCSKIKQPKCHTIAKSSSLNSIAINSHVNVIKFNNDNFYQSIGIKDACVFYGFCRHHDNDIFKNIENNNALLNAEQYFLVGYRALCLRLYLKECSSALYKKTELGNLNMTEGVDLAIDDLRYYKKLYDDILLTKSYENKIFYVVFNLDQIPPVMGSGFYFPEYDIKHQALNDLGDVNLVPGGFSISCIGCPSGKGGVVVLSAPEYSRKILMDFYDSFKNKADDEIFEIIVKVLFLYEENIVFSPLWWDALTSHQQNIFKEMFFQNMSPYSYDPKRSAQLLNSNHGLFTNIKIISKSIII